MAIKILNEQKSSEFASQAAVSKATKHAYDQIEEHNMFLQKKVHEKKMILMEDRMLFLSRIKKKSYQNTPLKASPRRNLILESPMSTATTMVKKKSTKLNLYTSREMESNKTKEQYYE